MATFSKHSFYRTRQKGRKFIKIKNFKDLKIDIQYKEVIDKYAKRTKKELVKSSPKRDTERVKPYNKGWTIVPQVSKDSKYKVVIWNRTNWQLTHLLEHGHLITNKKGSVGYARAKPHIQPTFENVEPDFVEAMRNALIEIEFK